MPKTRIPEIFLGVLLTIAVFGMGMLYESSRHSDRPAQQSSSQGANDEAAKAPQNVSRLQWLMHDAAGFFTFWLFVVGGAQAILFFVQLRLIRESLDDAKITANAAQDSANAAHRAIDEADKRDKVLQRAYLWPGPGQVQQVGDDTKIFITVHNTGRTVGVIKAVFYELCTEEEYKAGNPKFQRHDRENVIPPEMGGEMMRTGASVRLVGSGPMILHGYIIYTDIFQIERKCPWKHRVYRAGRSDPLPGCYSEWT